MTVVFLLHQHFSIQPTNADVSVLSSNNNKSCLKQEMKEKESGVSPPSSSPSSPLISQQCPHGGTGLSDTREDQTKHRTGQLDYPLYTLQSTVYMLFIARER